MTGFVKLHKVKVLKSRRKKKKIHKRQILKNNKRLLNSIEKQKFKKKNIAVSRESIAFNMHNTTSYAIQENKQDQRDGIRGIHFK